MSTKSLLIATLAWSIGATAFGAPSLTAVPGGLQSGNWVWTIDITPDLTLIPDNSGTPVAVELGFRLTNAELVSAALASPTGFDTANPGAKIFGWETPDPTANNRPVGLQINLLTDEIFAAYGSGNFTTPGAKHFLTIVTAGPGNPGGAASSTIEWLGIYGTGSTNGRITQVTGLVGTTYTTSNFNVHGFATQSIPEPASAMLLAIGAILAPMRRRRSAYRLAVN